MCMSKLNISFENFNKELTVFKQKHKELNERLNLNAIIVDDNDINNEKLIEKYTQLTELSQKLEKPDQNQKIGYFQRKSIKKMLEALEEAKAAIILAMIEAAFKELQVEHTLIEAKKRNWLEMLFSTFTIGLSSLFRGGSALLTVGAIICAIIASSFGLPALIATGVIGGIGYFGMTVLFEIYETRKNTGFITSDSITAAKEKKHELADIYLKTIVSSATAMSINKSPSFAEQSKNGTIQNIKPTQEAQQKKEIVVKNLINCKGFCDKALTDDIKKDFKNAEKNQNPLNWWTKLKLGAGQLVCSLFNGAVWGIGGISGIAIAKGMAIGALFSMAGGPVVFGVTIAVMSICFLAGALVSWRVKRHAENAMKQFGRNDSDFKDVPEDEFNRELQFVENLDNNFKLKKTVIEINNPELQNNDLLNSQLIPKPSPLLKDLKEKEIIVNTSASKISNEVNRLHSSNPHLLFANPLLGKNKNAVEPIQICNQEGNNLFDSQFSSPFNPSKLSYIPV